MPTQASGRCSGSNAHVRLVGYNRESPFAGQQPLLKAAAWPLHTINLAHAPSLAAGACHRPGGTQSRLRSVPVHRRGWHRGGADPPPASLADVAAAGPPVPAQGADAAAPLPGVAVHGAAAGGWLVWLGELGGFGRVAAWLHG